MTEAFESSLRSWALFGAALILAACGQRGPDADQQKAVDAAVLHVYGWADYIEPSVLEKFTAETGIRIKYDVFDSNATLETKLLTGHSGYDVVFPIGATLGNAIQAGAIQKLDRSKIPNWSNLDTEILKQLRQYDPDNEYGVSYVWGTDGIGYDAETVFKAMPNAPVDSWRLVFDPAVASQFKDCGISFVDSSGDVTFMVLSYLGRDPNGRSPQDLALAEQTLMAVRPYVRMIHSSSYKQALANGDICVAVGWSGDMHQAQKMAVQAGRGDAISYSIPKEGSIVWVDSMAIPIDAPHPDSAHVFINFMQRPDIAAANSSFNSFASGNATAYALVDEGVRDNPTIYPPRQARSRLVSYAAESPEYAQRLNRVWMRFVTGE